MNLFVPATSLLTEEGESIEVSGVAIQAHKWKNESLIAAED